MDEGCTLESRGRGQARDDGALDLGGPLPDDIVTTAGNLWIRDQFRNRTERICQLVRFNWKEDQLFNLDLSLKELAGPTGI